MMKKSILIITALFLVVLLTSPDSAKCQDSADVTIMEENAVSVMAGYGLTHNGMGKTKINVETIDILVGYENFLTGIIGNSFWRGRHSLVVEIPLHLVVDPWESPMVGMNFLARWTFENDGITKPYIFGGGGPLYTGADIDGLGSDINGNWQFGGGLRFPAFTGKELVAEYRFHHISNLGTKTPNDSLNSSKFLIGLRF